MTTNNGFLTIYSSVSPHFLNPAKKERTGNASTTVLPFSLLLVPRVPPLDPSTSTNMNSRKTHSKLEDNYKKHSFQKKKKIGPGEMKHAPRECRSAFKMMLSVASINDFLF